MEKTQIAIVGGGLIGPALALALKTAGIEAVVIDAKTTETRKAADFDGRAYAIALGSQRLLETLGIWEKVAGEAQPIEDIHVSEGTAPGPLLHFDPRELDEGRFGWILEDRYLRRALLDALKASKIPHLAPFSVSAMARDTYGATLTLNDGQALHADLVVAADGRRSGLSKMAGINHVGWRYDQTGLVNAISHELPHDGLAHQSFFPGGPFAVLPLNGNRSSLVWSERRATAERLSALPDEIFVEEIARRIGGRLGQIELIGKRWAYPLDLSLATAYAADRLALVGDAAHGVHPIAGQGMNMGLRDVAALAEVLTDAARIGEDIGKLGVLRRYQQWRRFDATSMALGMDALNRLFSNQDGALSMVRQAGLRMVDAMGTARRGFMREAIGAAGEVPRLLRGQAL
ncbi:MAG: FAD-dependent monooxygenase [Pseudomonadota bacterium]